MRQGNCPICNAPMWDKCPWDKGQGCIWGKPQITNTPNKPKQTNVAQLTPKKPTDRERRKKKAEQLRKWRGPKPLGRCVTCGTEFATFYPNRRRYCSVRCRGRAERQAHQALRAQARPMVRVHQVSEAKP